jgi:hypothetical protein
MAKKRPPSLPIRMAKSRAQYLYIIMAIHICIHIYMPLSMPVIMAF